MLYLLLISSCDCALLLQNCVIYKKLVVILVKIVVVFSLKCVRGLWQNY